MSRSSLPILTLAERRQVEWGERRWDRDARRFVATALSVPVPAPRVVEVGRSRPRSPLCAPRRPTRVGHALLILAAWGALGWARLRRGRR